MEIRVKTGKPMAEIAILNTYSPHIGYEAEIIKIYRVGEMRLYP